MAFNVSEAAAYAVLYSVLGLFSLLAIGSVGMLNFLPPSVTRFFALGHNFDSEETKEKMKTTDYFLAARNSASSISIALSFFASGQGAWIVYGTTEMGATPSLSWLGVLGYAFASSFPAILITWLGPLVRSYMDQHANGNAFCTPDFGRQRYGRVMHVVTALLSLFYQFIFMVAELTSISNVFGLLSNNFTDSFAYSISISMGVITVLYTTLAGLPASILTDKFQGLIMVLLVLMLTIAVCSFEENRITPEEFSRASNWTTDGLMAAVTLFLAINSAELFNQSTWQRVWAAEDDKSLRRGFWMGSAMVFCVMTFFGIMGMIAYANDPEAYDAYEKFAFLAFFDLLEPLQNGWHVVVLILVTALAASSLDSLQNGITCIFSADLVKIGWNPKWITRVLVVAVNIPAIYMASIKYDVISLFLVADLVCATSALPIFLGLQTNDFGILKAPTELGAFAGCISGVVTVLINGVVNDAEGGLFEYFWLRNGAICALCGSKTMVSFIITPLVSAVITYVVSFLDVTIRGDRARMPLIPIPFDEANSAVEGTEDDTPDDMEAGNDDVEDHKEAVLTNSENEEDRLPVIEVNA